MRYKGQTALEYLLIVVVLLVVVVLAVVLTQNIGESVVGDMNETVGNTECGLTRCNGPSDCIAACGDGADCIAGICWID